MHKKYARKGIVDSGFKKILYYLGIVAALYLFFAFILPFIFGVLGLAFKAIFYIFMWAAIAFVVFMLVVHIIKYIKKDAG